MNDFLQSVKSISGIFRSNSLFIGGNARKAVNEGRGDFTPIFLSEIPLLFRRNILNLDVALIQVKEKVFYCSVSSFNQSLDVSFQTY